MDDQTFNAIQVLAIKAVEKPGYPDFLRRVQRWYSQKFHISLAVVRAMSEHEVLSDYFEETYRELVEGDENARNQYRELRAEVLGPDHEAETEDDDWARQLNEEVAAQHRQEDRPKMAGEPNKAPSGQHKTTAEDRQVPEDANLMPETGFIQGEDEIPED